MATYTRYGTALSLFDIGLGQMFSGNLLYSNTTEFAITYADGSTAYFAGEGFVWDSATGKFTAGTVSAIRHYSEGTFNDSLLEISIAAASVQQLFETASDPDSIRVAFFSGNDILDGRHRLNGNLDGVKLIGYAGDDTIHGSAGADLLGGETGNDTIAGGAGADRIFGGTGDDDLRGGTHADSINAGSGDDMILGQDGNDILYGSSGNDVYIGGTGVDTVVYTRSLYDLVITPTASGFSIIEPNGTDTLSEVERIASDEGVFVFNAANAIWQQVSWVPGELLLNPGTGLNGTSGADTIDLNGKSENIVRAMSGNDVVTGSSGYDLLIGGGGADTLRGESGVVSGSLDRLYGDGGNDNLHGGGGGDILYGGIGTDRLNGGNGSDELTGGSSNDVFVFTWSGLTGAVQTWGHDLVRDFVIGVDHIELQFYNLPAGTPIVPVLYQTTSGAVISLEGAGTILLHGVDATGHDLEDFLI